MIADGITDKKTDMARSTPNDLKRILFKETFGLNALSPTSIYRIWGGANLYSKTHTCIDKILPEKPVHIKNYKYKLRKKIY